MNELVEPFRELFAKSLDRGPNHNAGNREVLHQYLRSPVSLTTIACKMMEQLVRNEVMEHMMTNNLLSSFQHGFVHGRSCTTRLLAVLDKWTEVIEQGESINAIYLDFAIAFDMAPQQRLLVKLKGYGICGKVL